ncbi:MAG: exodeoxyribonuclease V subunit alpha [Gammaproteobacteria bacterium]|nr:exodeoxyribonuclease V subunit alpha [Gammaproteobacteria bacterium]
MIYDFELLCEASVFSRLDIHFARFMGKLARCSEPGFLLAAALISSRTGLGHVCVRLAEFAGQPVAPNLPDVAAGTYPHLSAWLTALEQTSVVGKPGEYAPLILDSHARLYLYRYRAYEDQLARFFKDRAGFTYTSIDSVRLQNSLRRLFPAAPEEQDRQQKTAAAVTALKRLCVISGGPGTGKTATVIKILALLIEQNAPLRIALAAPTGKAAARLQETIRNGKKHLTCADAVKQAIPEQTATIHRLLGGASPHFRFNAQNPLPVDVLVIDEASMVDLALMAKLAAAIPPRARLLLLGDRDQLASVEAGAVLGDICGTDTARGFSPGFYKKLQKIVPDIGADGISPEASPNDLRDCTVLLRKNYRFGNHSGIGKLAGFVNTGDSTQALALLDSRRQADIQWINSAAIEALRGEIINGFSICLNHAEPAEALQAFRVLCAHRNGPWGVTALNRFIEETLRTAGLIQSGNRWYPGLPVMISCNDYNTGLFNGDTGIVLRDPGANAQLSVYFPSSQGGRRFRPARLPAHETVYAMSVHKSQGSEFDAACLVLPGEKSALLNRELLYTGITRVKRRLSILAPADILETAIQTRAARSSGLRDALL